MAKSIKDTFIENMIMNQHGEKIKKVQQLIIEGVEKSKNYIEKDIIWSVSKGTNGEVIDDFKRQLDKVNQLLKELHYNFLNVNMTEFKAVILHHCSDSLKEYEELVEALKLPYTCESCVHTYEEDNIDKVRGILDKEWDKAFKEVTLKSEEVILNSEETDKILKSAAKISEAKELGETISDAVRIFVNITNPDTSKDNIADIAKQIKEALKKDNGTWY